MEHNGKLMENKIWRTMMEKCMEHRGKLMNFEWKMIENERKTI